MKNAGGGRKQDLSFLLVIILVHGFSGVFEDEDDDENEEDALKKFQVGGSASKSSRNALMALSMN
jgi:hypothetical protein